MTWVYGASILLSIAGLALLDKRYRLAVWAHPRRSFVVVAALVVMFLLWDSAGIALGIFFRGSGPYQSGVVIAPELPIEEVAFLTLLCYLSVLVFVAFQRRFSRRES